MKPTTWVQRSFDFSFPVGLFPCILERVRGTPARVEELIPSLPPQSLTLRADDRWSIQEHVGHLYDLDELHDARLDDYLSNAKTLRPADITNQKTWHAKHNERSIQSIMNTFRTARMQFVRRLEQLDEELLSRTAIHPRLQQPMRVVDMVYFVAEHDDHHLACVTHLAKGLISRR